MIHLGDVLTVLGFRRQQHNQLSFRLDPSDRWCGGLGSFGDIEEILLESDGVCFGFGKFG